MMNGFLKHHLVFLVIVILAIAPFQTAMATPFDPLDDPSTHIGPQSFFAAYLAAQTPFSFDGNVFVLLEGAHFPGIPPVPFGPQPLPGNTEMVVDKLENIDPLPVGGSDTIDIEIVALQLKSIAPVEIEGIDWDVAAILNPLLTQDLGQMTINHEFLNGGSFSSTLPVKSLLIFTEVGNPLNTFDLQFFDTYNSTGAWSHTPGPADQHLALNGSEGGFFPDVDPFSGQRVSRTLTGLNSELTITAAIPEPGTLVLLVIGGLMLAIRQWHRRPRCS